jgi:type III secretion protein Q
MNDIAINDIILINSKYSKDKKVVYIRAAPDLIFYGRLISEGKITIDKAGLSEMEENTVTQKETVTDKLYSRIEEIPIQLVFQIGESCLTFSELGVLQPGYIFGLETDLKKPVTIKANGKAIGKGELVEIGNRIGIRVLQFENHKLEDAM